MANNPNSGTEPAGGNILLVLKPDAARDELIALLTNAGYQVLFPPSAEEAMERIAHGDLLILKAVAVTDRELHWLESLQNLEAGWHVPVIVITDHPEMRTTNRCLELGAADCLPWPIEPGRLLARVSACVRRKREMDEEMSARQLEVKAKEHAEALVSCILPISTAMMQGKAPIQLLEMILVESMRVTDCEGGTFYLRTDDDQLRFVIVRNDMLDINMGGSVGKEIRFPPLKMHDETGKPDHRYVANHAALSGTVVNVADAYSAGRFDFSGTRKFDASTGYRSKSFLTVPLKNARQHVIGVLQLINARDPRTGNIIAFSSDLQPTIEGLSCLALAVMEVYRIEQGQTK